MQYINLAKGGRIGVEDLSEIEGRPWVTVEVTGLDQDGAMRTVSVHLSSIEEYEEVRQLLERPPVVEGGS